MTTTQRHSCDAAGHTRAPTTCPRASPPRGSSAGSRWRASRSAARSRAARARCAPHEVLASSSTQACGQVCRDATGSTCKCSCGGRNRGRRPRHEPPPERHAGATRLVHRARWRHDQPPLRRWGPGGERARDGRHAAVHRARHDVPALNASAIPCIEPSPLSAVAGRPMSARTAPAYAGLRSWVRNRATGSTIAVYAEAADLDTEGGRWSTVCEPRHDREPRPPRWPVPQRRARGVVRGLRGAPMSAPVSAGTCGLTTGPMATAARAARIPEASMRGSWLGWDVECSVAGARTRAGLSRPARRPEPTTSTSNTGWPRASRTHGRARGRWPAAPEPPCREGGAARLYSSELAASPPVRAGRPLSA